MPACRQVTRLNVDPGDHKAVTQKLRSVPNLTHVLFLGRASGSAADRDLAADLEGFRSLVAAARAAGCPLQMTQFMTAEDAAKGALQMMVMSFEHFRNQCEQGPLTAVPSAMRPESRVDTIKARA